VSPDWEDGLFFGVEEIDVQHRVILRRLRQLTAAAAEGRAAEVRAGLRFLERYLGDHFGLEERWMAEQGYPGGREHERAHAALRDAISLARRTIDEQGGAGAAPAARIASALLEHLRTEDQRLGQFWTARENLRRLAEREPGTGVQLAPIPGFARAVAPAPADPPERPTPSAPPGVDAPRERRD